MLVVGASGSGKTRSIVTPNILQATGSYVIVDPKGNLYSQYASYLKKKGYIVQKLDFVNPGAQDTQTYNPFAYIRNDQDIIKMANMMIRSRYHDGERVVSDPFWDDAGEMLLVALIGYLYHYCDKESQSLHYVIKLLQAGNFEDYNYEKPMLDDVFEGIGRKDPDDFSYCCYKSYNTGADKTRKSILITLTSLLAIYDSKDMQHMLSEDTINIQKIGERKTALFVVISDTDRSMDTIANLFFTQAMNELCRIADARPDSRLPIDVRFILDDFATNVKISGFPRMIASIRSRGISAMIIIQAESQLIRAYREDGQTIIGNCDTYVYLGGNDVDTAERVAKRLNQPLMKILYMPVGANWIFRRGQMPIAGVNFELEPLLNEKMKEVEKSAPDLSI